LILVLCVVKKTGFSIRKPVIRFDDTFPHPGEFPEPIRGSILYNITSKQVNPLGERTGGSLKVNIQSMLIVSPDSTSSLWI
jgi:hypothetical protein